MKFYKILLTGSTCCGKTTAAYHIKEKFEQIGYKVIFVHESLNKNAFLNYNVDKKLGFDKKIADLFTMQMTNEQESGDVAVESGADKVLIVCLTSIPDMQCYFSTVQYFSILHYLNITKEQLFSRYDAVYHLPSVAKISAEQFHAQCGDKASCQKALEIDDRLLRIWMDHPGYTYIDAEKDFSVKINNLLKEIGKLMDDMPLLYTDTYLIKKPDLNDKDKMVVKKIRTFVLDTNVSVSEIFSSGKYIFRYTDGNKVLHITGKEFLSFVNSGDTSKRMINTSTYGFSDNNCYFTIIFFDHMSDKTVLQIDKKTQNDTVVLPDYIEIIKKI